MILSTTYFTLFQQIFSMLRKMAIAIVVFDHTRAICLSVEFVRICCLPIHLILYLHQPASLVVIVIIASAFFILTPLIMILQSTSPRFYYISSPTDHRHRGLFIACHLDPHPGCSRQIQPVLLYRPGPSWIIGFGALMDADGKAQ